METVQDVKMRLYIQTDKRTVEEEFGNMLDMRLFMDQFFSQMAERRSSKKVLKHVGPERRMPIRGRSAQRQFVGSHRKHPNKRIACIGLHADQLPIICIMWMSEA